MTAPERILCEASALVIVVEKLRLMGYAGFWVVVLVGMVLTKAFANIDLNETLLVEVFGYNNICVYFDFPPATYVLPFLWAVTLVLLLLYVAAHWLQMSAQVQQGTLSRKLYGLLSCLKLFEAFTLVSFSTIFAVNPMGWDHTLFIHTAPFLLLQVGLVSLAMSNTLHGINSGYWHWLGLSAWFDRAAIVHCILLGIVVCFKIPAAIHAMAGSPWWIQTDTFESVARFFDLMFLFLAAIVPMAKAAYLVYAKADKLEVVHLTANTRGLPGKQMVR